VHHDRFFVISLDGATDVGPFALGAELALMKDRTLYAMRETGADEGFPEPTALDLLQLGARAEYTASDEWLLAVEAFGAYALSQPGDDACKKPVSLVESSHAFSDCQYMLLDESRWLTGAVLLTSFSPAGLGLHFEVGGAVLTGPSLVLTPRIGYSLWDDLEVEVGALFVEGKSPGSLGATNQPELALGGVYDSVDQVFVGVRYLP
jgi:hypothetical protein